MIYILDISPVTHKSNKYLFHSAAHLLTLLTISHTVEKLVYIIAFARFCFYCLWYRDLIEIISYTNALHRLKFTVKKKNVDIISLLLQFQFYQTFIYFPVKSGILLVMSYDYFKIHSIWIKSVYFHVIIVCFLPIFLLIYGPLAFELLLMHENFDFTSKYSILKLKKNEKRKKGREKGGKNQERKGEREEIILVLLNCLWIIINLIF